MNATSRVGNEHTAQVVCSGRGRWAPDGGLRATEYIRGLLGSLGLQTSSPLEWGVGVDAEQLTTTLGEPKPGQDRPSSLALLTLGGAWQLLRSDRAADEWDRRSPLYSAAAFLFRRE